MSNVDYYARERIRKAAGEAERAIRFGAIARELFEAIATAVDVGAEMLAEDVRDEWRKAARGER
jgi:hypothetical protein